AESDGALRDAMARGAQELCCSCRPVWPVDRPCAWPKATPWHRARHGFKREPDPRRAGDERLERPLRLHLLSPPLPVQPVWRRRTLVLCVPATCTALTAGATCSSLSWRATRARSHASIFERTRPLQCPREAERIKYAIRLPANQVLQSRIGYLLTRPVGRPP